MRKKKIHTPGVGEEIGVFQPTVGEREVWGYGDVGEGKWLWGGGWGGGYCGREVEALASATRRTGEVIRSVGPDQEPKQGNTVTTISGQRVRTRQKTRCEVIKTPLSTPQPRIPPLRSGGAVFSRFLSCPQLLPPPSPRVPPPPNTRRLLACTLLRSARWLLVCPEVSVFVLSSLSFFPFIAY